MRITGLLVSQRKKFTETFADCIVRNRTLKPQLRITVTSQLESSMMHVMSSKHKILIAFHAVLNLGYSMTKKGHNSWFLSFSCQLSRSLPIATRLSPSLPRLSAPIRAYPRLSAPIRAYPRLSALTPAHSCPLPLTPTCADARISTEK